MSSSGVSTTPQDDFSWADAQRLQAFVGEVRLNLIRMGAILVFYAQHLLSYLVFKEDASITPEFHNSVTILVMIWIGAVAMFHYCLSRRMVHPGLKYTAMACDTAMIAALAALAGGPKSPLVLLLFLVI